MSSTIHSTEHIYLILKISYEAGAIIIPTLSPDEETKV